MSEARKNKSSWFLISLDPQEGKDCITSLTQKVPRLKTPLLKSRSHILKDKKSSLISVGEELDEEDDCEDSMSILEESHSWMTQTDAKYDPHTPCSKSRKTSKKYNRKEKSLGELCKKFIYLYGSKNYWIIALDECTYTLGVERRRIYDIINILESFNVLSRLAKNQYEWRGIYQIADSIQRMRQANPDDFAASPLKKRKKKKSLGILCESFIKQFLNWRSTISLEQAARRISDSHIDESKLKTKVRRLYDIANVLAALNLIDKTSLETRKPAFKWVGEQGLQVFIEEMEIHFDSRSVESKSPAASRTHNVSKFEFKPEVWIPTENPEITKTFERLNSASTSATFKKMMPPNDNELCFNIPTTQNIGEKLMSNSQVSSSSKPCQKDLNIHLVDLLEKLTLKQLTRPLYKPTPVYPINHFLTTDYSVSLDSANLCRNSGPLCWTKYVKTS